MLEKEIESADSSCEYNFSLSIGWDASDTIIAVSYTHLDVYKRQVNDLDPGLKDHGRRVLVLIVRRRAVDRIVTLRLYGALLVNRLAQHIEQAP